MTLRLVRYPEDMPDRTHEPLSSGRVPLLVSKTPDRAEGWARALQDAGIDAAVEITDRQVVQPGGSPLVGVFGAPPLDFVHVVAVQRADRERALAVLVDAGWDGREGRTWRRRTADTRSILVGSALAVAGMALFVLLRAAFS